MATERPFPYRWTARTVLPDRRGQLCRVVNLKAWHIGPAAELLIEFVDGHRVLAKKFWVKRATNSVGLVRPPPRLMPATMRVRVDGRPMTLAAAAALAGLPITSVRERLRIGWPIERALSVPLRPDRRRPG